MTTETTGQTNRVLQLMQKSMAGTERIDRDRNLLISFKPDSRTQKVNLDLMFLALRRIGLGPYWQTMQCDPDVIKGYTFGFIVPREWMLVTYDFGSLIRNVDTK